MWCFCRSRVTNLGKGDLLQARMFLKTCTRSVFFLTFVENDILILSRLAKQIVERTPRHYVCFHLKYASSNFSRQQTWRVNTKRLMHDYVSGSQFTTRPLSWEIFLNLWHLHVVFTRMFFSSLLVWEFVAWYIVVKTLFDPGPLGIVCLLPSQQPVLKSKLKSCRPQLFSVMKLFSLSEFFSRDVNRNGEFSFMFPVWIHI